MRIASLVPSGTEIVQALGLDDCLVGVTYGCRAPGRPVLVHPRRDKSGWTQAQIDAAGAAESSSGSSPFVVDEELLQELRPDLVLTQDTCAVCALPGEEGCRVAPAAADVVVLDAHTLEDMLATVQQVADAAGRSLAGRTLVERLRERVLAVRERTRNLPVPRVVCLEWMDPPWSAGHWVPELVALAGGQEVMGVAGMPSRRLGWAEVRASSPQCTVLMPCSLGQERTLHDAEHLDLIGLGAVWAAAGGNLFAKASPGLVDGLETLAALLHPEGASQPRYPARQLLPAAR